jgi:hypothetical protein
MAKDAKDGEFELKIPKKSAKGDLPDNVKDWVKYINDCHDRGLEARKKNELQWVINFAYYLGHQNMVYNAVTRSVELNLDEKAPLTINRVGAFIDSRHAKLTKNRPTPRVIPNSKDIDDQRSAKFSDQLLLNLWRKIGMEEEYHKTILTMLINCVAFIKTTWDPNVGDYIDQDIIEDGEISVGDEGIESERIFLGEISSKFLSPFQLIPANDGIPTIKDQEWVLERGFSSNLSLENIYPHLRGKIKKSQSESLRTEYERIVQRLSNAWYTTQGNSALWQKRDMTNTESLVKTFWMRPNYQYEKGFMAVIIGDEMAMCGTFPNDYGKNVYPYVRFSEKEDGYHFFPQATIERLLPIQKAFNKLRSQKLKNVCLMANGKWMVAKGSGISDEALTDEEGEVVEWNSAVPRPEQAIIAPMPNYVSELALNLITDFRDVGGQRESSVSPPPNLTAAVSLEVAAEQADEGLGPNLRSLARAMELVAEQQLILANKEYIEKRKVKIIGQEGLQAVEYLSGMDLKNQTDVHIEVESLFPDFRGARVQRILDLWDRRIVDDPTKILKAIRFGNIDALLEDAEREDEQIFLDIQKLKRGKEPEITPFQNHFLYVAKISDFLSTPEFARLIPQRKEAVVRTLQGHLAFLQQTLPAEGEPQAQTNQAAVGTPFGSQVTVGSR